MGRVAVRKECTTPKALGMVGIPREDGVIIWGFRSADAYQEKLERMAKARAARAKEKK